MSDEDDKKPAIFGMSKKPNAEEPPQSETPPDTPSASPETPSSIVPPAPRKENMQASGDNDKPEESVILPSTPAEPVIPPAPPAEEKSPNVSQDTEDKKEEAAIPPLPPAGDAPSSTAPAAATGKPDIPPAPPPPSAPSEPLSPAPSSPPEDDKKVTDSPSSAVKESDFDTDFDDLDDDDFAADLDEGLGDDLDDLPPLDDPIEGEFESDFDDLDSDFDDFEDDDFGDEDSALAAGPAAAAAKKPAGQKSFLMKNFNAIVIGVAVVIGAGIFVTQFMGAPSKSPQMTAPEQEMAKMAEQLPQPAPIAPTEQASPSKQEPLTPMPSPDSPAVKNTKLPDLDIDRDQSNTQIAQLNRPPPPPPPPSAANTNQPAENVEPPPQEPPISGLLDQDPVSEFEQMAENLQQDTATESEQGQPENTDLEQTLDLESDVKSMPELLDLPEENIQEETEEAEAQTGIEPEPELAFEPEIELPETPEPMEDLPEPEKEAAIEAEEMELSAKPQAENDRQDETPEPDAEIALDNQEPAENVTPAADPEMQEKIKAANDRIAQLTQMLDQMENKIEELESVEPIPSPAAAPSVKTPAEVESKKEEPQVKASSAKTVKPPRRPDDVPAMKSPPIRETRSVSAVPATPPKRQTKPRLNTASAPAKWQLRSAQIGRAVVSDKNTGDLRSVEVGDTLPGIGKILSISPQNGRWVVQGSKGRILQ